MNKRNIKQVVKLISKVKIKEDLSDLLINEKIKINQITMYNKNETIVIMR